MESTRTETGPITDIEQVLSFKMLLGHLQNVTQFINFSSNVGWQHSFKNI